jgi:hypothetical protein
VKANDARFFRLRIACVTASERGGRARDSLAEGDTHPAEANGCPIARCKIPADPKREFEWTADLDAHVRLGCVFNDSAFPIKENRCCR